MDLQKLLASQVTLYGEHINFLALYFPEVGMVITQSRYLTGDETAEFFINYHEKRHFLVPRHREKP